MKRAWMAVLTSAGLLACTGAMAQDEAAPPQGAPMAQDDTWTVRPEERTVIHDYVVKERIRPVQVQEDVTVGAPVPQGVELAPVPQEIYTSVPESRRYEYFDWNGRVVFVDPDTRKVVQIVD
jgi:Protein of unknown function (DUF1236)